MKYLVESRKREQGQTLLLVVVAMGVLVGMAALAIDIATLYTAHNETRRTAEAAALAGAHVIATSGFTSGRLTQSQVCSGNVASPGLAEQRALKVVQQNQVAGGAATLQAASCNFGVDQNPQFTVTVQRTGLPTFFGRLWGSFPGSATVTATAEVYNPSGATGPPIQVGSVKPWAVPNCDPTHSTPVGTNCGSGVPSVASLIDPSNNYDMSNALTGTVIDLKEFADPPPNWVSTTPPTINFLAVDVPITASTVSCPSASQVSCTGNGLVLDPAAPGFQETIACANSQQLSCGQTLTVDPNSGNPGNGGHITSQQAALCMIHASGTGPSRGQDQFCNNASSPSCPPSSPISIDGGDNNPDPLLQGKNNISRSDSVVTLPIFNPSCAGTGCTNSPVTIVGFLQLGLVRVRGSGPLRTVVMNVVGCGSTGGSNPVSGGGVSPLPVRLVQ